MARNRVDLVLQAKGGVGKSLIAAILTQHHMRRGSGTKVVAVDTDPANATLFGYKALPVRRVNILMEGAESVVDPRAFDVLIDSVVSEDADFVIDNGANCYFPLLDYVRETEAFSALIDAGKDVFLHSVVTGGQALGDTVRGFDSLANAAPPEARLVVWLNQYFGAIGSDGKEFEQMAVYQRHQERIHALVTIPKLNPYTSGKDLELMIARKLTFEEALTGTQFGLMEKQRLKAVQKAIFPQLALLA